MCNGFVGLPVPTPRIPNEPVEVYEPLMFPSVITFPVAVTFPVTLKSPEYSVVPTIVWFPAISNAPNEAVEVAEPLIVFEAILNCSAPPTINDKLSAALPASLPV